MATPHLQSSNQSGREFLAFAKEPSEDKTPCAADVNRFVLKRMKEFHQLQGLIQKSIKQLDSGSKTNMNLMQDINMLQKKRDT